MDVLRMRHPVVVIGCAMFGVLLHCAATEVASCPLGLADCDLDLSTGENGCETPLSTTDHCGACAKKCQAGEACVRSVQGVECTSKSACSSPSADCNGDVGDGCEVDTSNDPANCGRCGHVCSGANSDSPSCTNGVCVLHCKAGFADCDRDATNGCEAALDTVAHCGSCGSACGRGATCVGAGSKPACECTDSSLTLCANGCTNTKGSDIANCGGCGHTCKKFHEVCDAGTCTCPNGADCTCDRPPAGGDCTLFPQCGCGAGEGCFLKSDKEACATEGSVGVNQPVGSGSCAAGTGNFGGICKKWCATDSDCPGTIAGRCRQATGASGAAIPGAKFCATSLCNPAHPQTSGGAFTACPTDFHCLVASGGLTDCAILDVGHGTQGTTCTQMKDCAPNYYCGNEGVCVRYCLANADCDTGGTCNFTFGLKAASANVGFCDYK